jgi:hypothetical protein
MSRAHLQPYWTWYWKAVLVVFKLFVEPDLMPSRYS